MTPADARPSGLPPPSPDDLIGTMFADRYRIAEPLAHGGMGAVFLGVDQRSGNEVAIKIVRGELAHSEEALARFHREVRAVAALDSPYVVAAYDAGSIDGMPYLVMERLRGRGLDELAASGDMPPRRAVRVVIDILTGLAHAHGAGIIHRDLKPSNIWITEDGHVKILDFGVAKVQGATRSADDETGKLTGSGAVLGSPAYMSPEQLVSSKEADERADIWSVGTVLYELLSGSMLFKAETVGGIFANVIRMRIPPLREVLPGASPELERIVGRCLERDAGERFRSAAAVADALRALLEADERGEAPLVREGAIGTPPPASVTVQASGTDASFEESPTVALPRDDAPDGRTSDEGASRLWLLGVAIVAILGVAAIAIFVGPRPSPATGALSSTEPTSLESAATTASAREEVREATDAPMTASAPSPTAAPAPSATATASARLDVPPRRPPAPLRPSATVPPEDDLWETSRH